MTAADPEVQVEPFIQELQQGMALRPRRCLLKNSNLQSLVLDAMRVLGCSMPSKLSKETCTFWDAGLGTFGRAIADIVAEVATITQNLIDLTISTGTF